jgi:hypothetical protein
VIRQRRAAAQRALSGIRGDDDSDDEHEFEDGAPPIIDAGAHPGSGDEYQGGNGSDSDSDVRGMRMEVRSEESNDGVARKINYNTDRAQRRAKRNAEKEYASKYCFGRINIDS